MTSSSSKIRRFGPEWRKARADVRRILRKVRRRSRRNITGRDVRGLIRFSMYLDAWVERDSK